jgi:amino acid transporter
MATRVCYGMARQQLLPAVFAKVHAVTRTPAVSTVMVSVMVLMLALWFPIESLAKATSYFLLLVFCLVNLSLWQLKRTVAQPAGIFCVSRWVPATGFIASFAFVIVQVTLDLQE